MPVLTQKKDAHEKAHILGQFFTKKRIARKLLGVLAQYREFSTNATILEPSAGCGNFVTCLDAQGFTAIDTCELDARLTDTPRDFFHLPLDHKYDLIIGNPPFSKYNVQTSYYYASRYTDSPCTPFAYIRNNTEHEKRQRIEHMFLLKALRHCANKESVIAFILPISFFIKRRNLFIKETLIKHFSTLVIFQDTHTWFDYNIPCCFAMFMNSPEHTNTIILTHETDMTRTAMLDISAIHDELIPAVYFNKKNLAHTAHETDIALGTYVTKKSIKYHKTFSDYTISGANITSRATIPDGIPVHDFKLAVTRVGNGSVGKCGLINIQQDILNDMFYVFDFHPAYNENKTLKEKICALINAEQQYFKDITCRVGSKSIRKSDVLNFPLKHAMH